MKPNSAKPLKCAIVAINDYALTSFERPDFDTFIVKSDNKDAIHFINSISSDECNIKTVSNCGIYSSAIVRLDSISHFNIDCFIATFKLQYYFDSNANTDAYKPKGGFYEIQ